MPRDSNPPNCPELRPVEKYWGILKQKFRKSRKEAHSINNFKVLWKKATDEVDEACVQKLMGGIKAKTRLLIRGVELN